MYNSQITKERIKQRCKSSGVTIKELLADCGLSVNAINQINDTAGMYSFNLARIADRLDVSVDYLLGRTDNPDINK